MTTSFQKTATISTELIKQFPGSHNDLLHSGIFFISRDDRFRLWGVVSIWSQKQLRSLRSSRQHWVLSQQWLRSLKSYFHMSTTITEYIFFSAIEAFIWKPVLNKNLARSEKTWMKRNMPHSGIIRYIFSSFALAASPPRDLQINRGK